ncbi:hypothetical protein ABIE69_002271 [Rhodobacteraceae bacterium MBR-64]|jgi:hypothetical protein
MKILFNFDDEARRTEVVATPDPYESHQLNPVIVYGTPKLRNPDRLYVATALLFRGLISGPITIETVEPCSRHVALEIERYFTPFDVFVAQQTVTPRGCADGALRALLSCSRDFRSEHRDFNPQRGDTLFRLVPEGVGAVFSEHELVLGTNILTDADAPEKSVSGFSSLVGAMVLFCEDFQIRDIRIPPAWTAIIAPNVIENTRRLLSVVSLHLEA